MNWEWVRVFHSRVVERAPAPYFYLEVGCLIWHRSKTVRGREVYPQVKYRGGQWDVHRLSLWLYDGQPDWSREDQVCLQCDRVRCIEPSHLLLGSALQNHRERLARRAAHLSLDSFRKLCT